MPFASSHGRGLGWVARRVPGKALATYLLGFLAALFVHPAWAADIRYQYDAAGRLVRAATTSDSATYQYDPAGNITRIARQASAQLSLVAFAPATGSVGAQVLLTGSGFSAVPANNLVDFNGTAAVVLAATTTTLTVQVPASASDGPIRVRVASAQASSATAFRVLPSHQTQAPHVLSVSPSVAAAGDTVTVSGLNFGSVASELSLRVGSQLIPFLDQTSTQIRFVVPTPLRSGPVVVHNRNGASQQVQHLFVPLSGMTPADIGTTGAVVVDGASVSFSIANGKRGMVVFQGIAGQNLGLGISGLALSPATGSNLNATVYRPDGQTGVCDFNSTAPGGSCDLQNLPASGTYAIVLNPGNASATFSLTLSSDVLATLQPNGSPQVFSTLRPGQNARLRFAGVAGSNYTVMASGSTFASSFSASFLRPDNTYFAGLGIQNGQTTRYQMRNLSTTGDHTVFLSPSGADTGSVTLSLRQDLTQTIAIDGASLPLNLAPGQNATVQFQGRAGQNLGVGISDLNPAFSPTTGNYLGATIERPDGQLVGCGIYNSSPGASCDLQNLPLDGTYAIVLNPGNVSATFSLTLSNDIVGTLQSDGTPWVFNTQRPGQNARLRFAGAVGDNFTLMADGSSFSTYVTGEVFYTSAPNSWAHAGTIYNRAFRQELSALRFTGDHTVLLNPYKGETGQVTVSLRRDLTQTITIDGASLPVDLAPGQTGRVRFQGRAGQRLGLGISGLNMRGSAALYTYVLMPDGVSNLISTCPGANTTSGGTGCDMRIPADGTYTIKLDPQLASATFMVTLSSDAESNLPTDGSTFVFESQRPGLNGRLRFHGEAGGTYSLRWSGSTFANWAYASVQLPDGTTQGNWATIANGATGRLKLSRLPVTGEYTLYFNPYLHETGRVTLALQADVPQNIEIDGPSLPVSLDTGQNASVRFRGQAGQNIGLGASGLTMSPLGTNYLYATFVNSTGTAITSTCDYNNTLGVSCNLRLPADDEYTLLLDPSNASAAFSLTLSSDLTDTIEVNGPTRVFSSQRPGQNGRMQFAAVAGGRYRLSWSGSNFAEYVLARVLRPDNGQVVHTAYIHTGASSHVDIGPVPVAGNYTVFLDPNRVHTGQVTLQITGDRAPEATSPGDGDVPLPPWSLLLLAAAFFGALARSRR